MPESNTEEIDYYPPGWTEEMHSDDHVEWLLNTDELIQVVVQPDDVGYSVIPRTGVKENGEQFETGRVSQIPRETAFEVAIKMVYAMNGVYSEFRPKKP